MRGAEEVRDVAEIEGCDGNEGSCRNDRTERRGGRRGVLVFTLC